MKTAAKRVLIVTLSFMVLFCCVGYATLSDTLTVSGNFLISGPTDDVIIVSFEQSDKSAGAATAGETYFYPTNVMSAVTLGSTSDYVTYKIVVRNRSTSIKYSYAGIAYDAAAAGYNGNAYYQNGLTVTVTGADGQELNHDTGALDVSGGELTFFATYKISDASLAGTELKTLLNYKFGVHFESAGDAAVDNATEQFEQILNDTTPGGAFETLDNFFQTTDNGTGWLGTGAYVGNVVGSGTDDSALVDDLFTDENGDSMLKLTAADGTEKNVTCLIKQQDLTVNGVERQTITIYMTPDEITGTTSWGGHGAAVNVYAAVYVQNASGAWAQWGDMYYGQADSNNYNGGWGSGQVCNSFDTGTWESLQHTYRVADAFSYGGSTFAGYEYTVAAGRDITTVLGAAVDDAAWEAFVGLYDITGLVEGYSGDAVTKLEAVRKQYSQMYSAGKSGALQSEIVAAIYDLYAAMRPFLGS